MLNVDALLLGAGKFLFCICLDYIRVGTGGVLRVVVASRVAQAMLPLGALIVLQCEGFADRRPAADSAACLGACPRLGRLGWGGIAMHGFLQYLSGKSNIAVLRDGHSLPFSFDLNRLCG